MTTKLPDLPEDMQRPEPKEIDEKLSLQLRHLADDAVLQAASPTATSSAPTASTTPRSTRRSATAGT